MDTISLQDFQRDPLSLLRRVEAGEYLLLTRENRPVIELRPARAPSQTPRPFGMAAGQFTVPDDFDAPLPEEILREFEGK